MGKIYLLRFCAILSLAFFTGCSKAELIQDQNQSYSNQADSALSETVQPASLRNANIDRSSWMGLLSDHKTICDLSIPAAHDAGASKSGGFMFITQNSSLKDQLLSGVRGFDIRLKAYANKELAVYHSIANQYTDFKRDVLDMMTEYLANHPTEFILLHVKREGNPTSGTKDYNDLIKEIINNHPERERFTTLDSPRQTVGSLRGKLVIVLRNHVPDFSAFSSFHSWDDNATFDTYLSSDRSSLSIRVEDQYVVKGVSDSPKWDAVVKHMRASRNAGSSLYITFLSGTGVFFPPKRVAGNMNRLAVEEIKKDPSPVKGLFFMDFCGSDKGKELTMELIKQNL